MVQGIAPPIIRAKDTVRWPTPNHAFYRGEPSSSFIQPTESGVIESGLFGCVREDGQKFHEAIDLKALRHDSKGEAADSIVAAMNGRVVYVNRVVSRSDYGRYVVIEHFDAQPAIYTLYAHLSRVKTGVRIGTAVNAGAVLGVMGRSANGGHIPKARAHLHFEMGLRVSDNFGAWYDKMDFDTPNYHGNYNGVNLVGFDPMDFFIRYRDGRVDGIQGYVESLHVAYRLRVATGRTPSFVRRYPCLLTRPMPNERIVGWIVEFTGFGLPISWTPLVAGDLSAPISEGDVTLLSHTPSQLHKFGCRNGVVMDPGGVELGESLRRTIQLLFGFL